MYKASHNFLQITLEFPTNNFDFHLLTTSVNAKYYYYKASQLGNFYPILILVNYN